jgi:hypothetical protein
MAPSDRQLFYLPFSVLAVSSGTSGYSFYLHIHMTCYAQMASYFEGSVAYKYMLVVIMLDCITFYCCFIPGVCWHAAIRLSPDHRCFTAAARGS